jgi:hypothetical protein
LEKAITSLGPLANLTEISAVELGSDRQRRDYMDKICARIRQGGAKYQINKA